MNLNIDIGQGSYWSELMQIQTLDNMMNKKIIPDALTYLESLPDGYVKNKQAIIEKIKSLQVKPLVPEAALPNGSIPPGQLMPGTAMPQGQAVSAEAQLISGEEAAAIAADLLKLPDEQAQAAMAELEKRLPEGDLQKDPCGV